MPPDNGCIVYHYQADLSIIFSYKSYENAAI